MKPFVIVGTGGLGRELLGWIAGGSADAQARFSVAAFISEAEDVGSKCHGVPVLAPHQWQGPPPRFVIGFADPHAKKRLALQLEERGWDPDIYIHESAAVGIGAKIGPGTVICPFCRISTDATIGRHVLVNGGSGVGHDAIVGDYTSMLGCVSVNGNARVGEAVLLGAHSMIYPGKRVGEGATVGIASVVLSNVRADTTVFGNPARRVS